MNPDRQNNYWEQDPDEATQTSATEAEASDQAQEKAPENATPSERIKSATDEPVNWTASEYISLEKSTLWFVAFGLVVLGFIAIGYFLLQTWTFSLLVIVMAIAVIVYTRRPPREIQYTLSGKHGLYVGDKLYNLADFKAFGLIRDGENHSIMLIPIKRFAVGVSVYFPQEAGEKIVDILGARLPMENLKLDMIDVIVRRLRL